MGRLGAFRCGIGLLIPSQVGPWTIDVYRCAETTGEQITLGLVERHLDELRSHQPDCQCGLCTAAHAARPSGVFYVASRWAGGIAATRRRAVR
jgi:hypothetical protein